MKYKTINEENRIYINIYSITKNEYKFLEYPGISNIFVKDSNDLHTPLFVTGVGIVKRAGETSGYKIGQRIAFFGFCRHNIVNEIITSQNSVVYIPTNISLDDAAYCMTFLPFVSLAKRIHLKLGENVFISGNTEYVDKLKYVIDLFGFNIYNKNSTGYVDVVILCGNKSKKTISNKVGSGTKFYLIPDVDYDSEDTVISDNVEVIKYIGKGYYDEDFQLSNKVYPYGYVRGTLKYDAKFCLDMMEKGTLSRNEQISIKEKNNYINQECKVSIFSYIKEIADLYVNHMEPALLQITCFCDEPNFIQIEDFLREATYILKSHVTHIEFFGDIEKNHSVSVTFKGGSVAVINIITGFKAHNKNYQLSWDGQSASYTSGGKIIFYTPKIQEIFVDSNAKTEVNLQYEDNIKRWKQYWINL